MKRILQIIPVLLLATSCIYPYSADIEDVEGHLVIEGDILIGAETTVDVSYMIPLGSANVIERPNVLIDVQDDAGDKYKGVSTGQGRATVDTKDAPADRKYRLRVKNLDNGKMYYSKWKEVQTAPDIDSLGYIINKDSTKMDITLSLTAMQQQRYYRWTFVEEWEYHAYYYAECYCVPGNLNSSFPSDTVAHIYSFRDGHNTYYCWNRANSEGVLLGSVEGLRENKLVNHKFFTIDNRDTRMSYLYRMTVMLQAIDQDGYDYWKNLDAISNPSGSFDTPNPGEMVGNLYCEDDPNEYVTGYINVSGIKTATRYIEANKIKFYDNYEDRIRAKLENVKPEKWNTYYYQMYYRPVTALENPMNPEMSIYNWAYATCVDCTLKGGSKKKRPADWPNNHY